MAATVADGPDNTHYDAYLVGVSCEDPASMVAAIRSADPAAAVAMLAPSISVGVPVPSVSGADAVLWLGARRAVDAILDFVTGGEDRVCEV